MEEDDVCENVLEEKNGFSFYSGSSPFFRFNERLYLYTIILLLFLSLFCFWWSDGLRPNKSLGSTSNSSLGVYLPRMNTLLIALMRHWSVEANEKALQPLSNEWMMEIIFRLWSVERRFTAKYPNVFTEPPASHFLSFPFMYHTFLLVQDNIWMGVLACKPGWVILGHL